MYIYIRRHEYLKYFKYIELTIYLFHERIVIFPELSKITISITSHWINFSEKKKNRIEMEVMSVTWKFRWTIHYGWHFINYTDSIDLSSVFHRWISIIALLILSQDRKTNETSKTSSDPRYIEHNVYKQ